MAILDVTNLTKHFSKFIAVDNVTFSLKEGEILGLLGPNGAGKTTTIQMLLGVLTPTSGSVSFFGKNLKDHKEYISEKINFSTTYTNLPWVLTVHEVLRYTSLLYDIPNRKQKVAELIENFRMKELLNIKVSDLSAGQLTRLNLTKAFINDPKVLLLDEPTASLDPEVARFVRDFILKRRDESQLSIIFTSHNMAEVEEVCDRILFINNGKIVADDTPENLTKTIEICKVQLIIDKKNEHNLVELSRKMGWKHAHSEREHVIELKEREISQLLSAMSENGIQFHEISIDKPDLEDYFLMVAHDNQNRDM